MEHKFSPPSGHEPEPYVRTTATYGDHDALAETLTAETATTASGADKNDEDPDDKHNQFQGKRVREARSIWSHILKLV